MQRGSWNVIEWRVIFGVLLICPTLWAYSGGTGEPNDPYQIATAEDLIALGNKPNDYNGCFILTADIDLSGYVFDRAVIAPDEDKDSSFDGTGFSGSFDGQGHIISHLSIQGKYYLGFIGRLNEDGLICDLGLEMVDVNGIGDYIGGLVGKNRGLIISSYSMGSVSGTGNSVGGLMGSNSGSVTSSYSTCSVGGDSVGGLVESNCGSIASSFWDTETSGQNTSDGGTGLTTAEMQDPNNYLEAGWDLVDGTAHSAWNYWVV